MATERTGVDDLDRLLSGGVLAGDNVVWVGDDSSLLRGFATAFAGVAPERTRYVLLSDRRGVPDGLHPMEVLDARPRGALADPLALERALVESPAAPGARVVMEGFDALVRRWGAERAVGYFVRVCPRLFDVGATAYWTATRRAVGATFVDAARKVTQCLFEVRADQLRIVKAEGQPSHLQGALVSLRRGSDGIRLGREQALGRLGEGLRRLRQDRNLSQTDLARLADVSPSAISQTESGRRGLSLDTLVVLAERLGVSLDELLAREPSADYVLARRDRLARAPRVAALLDDPSQGLRAYFVRLGPAEEGAPSMLHKGAELVLVAHGLVSIDLGDTTPVLRAGDAILATRAPIRGWRNLQAGPASLFWILRD
jgi:transcriptional regulator with XRE-family HTH domain